MATTVLPTTFITQKKKYLKSDYQIKQDVTEQIKWEPLLKAAEIDVAVKTEYADED